jgi:hypothetical protein
MRGARMCGGGGGHNTRTKYGLDHKEKESPPPPPQLTLHVRHEDVHKVKNIDGREAEVSAPSTTAPGCSCAGSSAVFCDESGKEMQDRCRAIRSRADKCVS